MTLQMNLHLTVSFHLFFVLKFGDVFLSSKASSWNMTQLIPISDIRNWIRNIEQHASDNVNKILVGNKADMDESKRVCKHLGPFSELSRNFDAPILIRSNSMEPEK